MPDVNKTTEAVRNGILQPQGRGATPPPPGEIAASEGQPDEKATAQEQQQYYQLLDNISMIIDGEKGLEKGHQKIMDMMEQNKDDPGRALSNAVTAVGDSIMKHAEKEGIDIPDDMLVAAAMDSLMMLSDLAAEAGFFEATEEDIANGYGLALMNFMQNHPDKVDWQGLQASFEQADPAAIESAKTMYGAGGQEGQPQQATPAMASAGGAPMAPAGGAPQQQGLIQGGPAQ